MSNYTKNKNALKWTPEKVKRILGIVKENARNNPETLFINEALSDIDISRKAWSYWREIFADEESIIEQMDVIHAILETKLTRAARKGEIPIPLAIFALKHNYQWSDRPQAAEVPYIEVQPQLRPDLNLHYILGQGRDFRVLPLEELATSIAKTSLQSGEA